MLDYNKLNVFEKRMTLITVFLITIISYIIFLLISELTFCQLTPDGYLYANIAENFISGNGLVNTIRSYNIVVPPGFPVIISIVMLFFGNISYIIFVNLILFGLTAVLVFIFTNELFKKSIIGYIAVVLYIFNPVILENGPRFVLTETIFTFLTTAIIYLVIKTYRLGSQAQNPRFLKNLYTLVIFFTLSLVIRPHFLFLLPVLLIYIGFSYFTSRIKLKNFILLALIPTISLGLNSIINYRIHHQFVLLENYSGANLYIANNPDTKVEFYSSHKIKDFVEPEYFELDDADFFERNSVLKGKAIKYILDHPLITIRRSVAKMVKLLFYPITFFDRLTIYLFLLGGLISLITNREQRISLLVIILMIAYYSLLTSMGLILIRYRTPIVPTYLIFSSFSFYWLLYMLNKPFSKAISIITK